MKQLTNYWRCREYLRASVSRLMKKELGYVPRIKADGVNFFLDFIVWIADETSKELRSTGRSEFGAREFLVAMTSVLERYSPTKLGYGSEKVKVSQNGTRELYHERD